MISSDFRAEARRKLAGKWGKGACIMLAFLLVTFVINFIIGLLPDSYEWLGQIIDIVINVPLSFGILYAFLKLYKDENVGAFDFFKLGFNNFGKSWSITFNIFLKMIVPAIVIIISYILIAVGISLYYTSLFVTYSTSAVNGYVFIAIIGFILLVVSSIWATTKYYFYQLAFLISIENEDMSAEEAVTESKKAMTGKRAGLFWLQLSFIGWAILGAISFGIGFLWIIPYVHCATIAFYKYAIGDSSNVEVQSIDDDSKTAE